MANNDNKPLMRNPLSSEDGRSFDIHGANLEKADLEDANDHLLDNPFKIGQGCLVILWRSTKSLLYSARFYLLSCLTLLLLLSVAMGGIALIQLGGSSRHQENHHHHHHHDSNNQLSEYPTAHVGPLSPEGLALTCGTTNEEARANDCTFDVMTFAWTPPACWEPDLAAETVSTESRWASKHRAGIFGYYHEHNDTKSLPQDAAVLSELAEVWTTRDWHIAHCLYYWRLLGRAVNRSFDDGVESAYVISQGIVWGHTVHCNDVLAGRENTLAPRLQLYRLYGSCVRINAKPDSTLNHGDFFVDPNRLSGAGSGGD
jgi:hypothetical protein